ncbi:hypothetical protein C2857_007683 [Epichloe festucae Fl1]|uniref:Non-homologous end-joining factor 1 n=1 Tax=Epichloe festucae (strain Fl1) TaxID=877507 RepID=A0A7S9KMM3_EPIFF|nr:hypothetical protein C2857_007683 [Epichloe festucae Fl1]
MPGDLVINLADGEGCLRLKHRNPLSCFGFSFNIMSTVKPETWRPLPMPVSSGLPVLLVSVDVGPSSYAVSISDMANIWSENLDRKAICMRGWSENTSIDPSDTAENMTKFLSCLKAALDPAQKGHNTTSLTLSPAARTDAGEGGLTIKLTCRLSGLDPLRWPMHLKKQPPSTVATELVLPLIQSQSDKIKEVDSLMEIIKRKDAVITKLADKLEAMGAGLEHVFTALSGRKKVTRAAAEDRVKGVGLFDELKWKDELDTHALGSRSVGELVQGVFGEKGLESRTSLEIDKSPELGKWWHDFQPTIRISPQKQTESTLSKDGPPSIPLQPTNGDDDDDFQIQSTPPHLKSTEETYRATNRSYKADVIMEEEQDSMTPDAGPPPVLSDRRRQPETTTTSSRLGAIGGKKQPAQPRSPLPPADGYTAKLSLDDNEETASEASDEDDVTASLPNTSPVSSSKDPAPKQAQKKGGLGTIGGGAKEADPLTKEPEATIAKNTNHQNLGTIKGKLASPVKQEDNESRGRTKERDEGSPLEQMSRETSQERADRKREELKRELEKKAAAGPVRKKRRF